MQRHKYKSYLVAILIIFFVIKAVASDEAWDEVRFYGLARGRTYEIDSGSGFFINSNMVVTNRHVVSGCINIAIRGAVPPQRVKLYAVDNELDLALLQTVTSPIRVPYIRQNYKEVKQGDTLFSVGYPLERGKSGVYIIKQANVISTQTEKNGFSRIEFTDTVDHGNSGGPLLDANSNLVGVVTAKLTYSYNDDTSNKTQVVSVAIGIDGLQEFLRRNNAPFSASSTYDIFTNYHLDRLVKDYVVNIHCIKN